MSNQRNKFNANFTCIGHLVGRCSAALDSYAVNPPSAGRSRRAQCFSFSSHHKGYWCRGRTEQAGCIPLAPVPRNGEESGDTFAGCTGWSQAPSWCRPQHILIAENHTSHKVHSPVPPSSTGFLHSTAWAMKLGGWNNGAKPQVKIKNTFWAFLNQNVICIKKNFNWRHVSDDAHFSSCSTMKRFLNPLTCN